MSFDGRSHSREHSQLTVEWSPKPKTRNHCFEHVSKKHNKEFTNTISTLITSNAS